MSTQNQPELEKEMAAIIPSIIPDQHVGKLVEELADIARSFASQLLDEIGLEGKVVVGDWTPEDLKNHGYNQAKADLDAKIKETKSKYGL